MTKLPHSCFPTSIARQSLAARLGLPYSDLMQDWEWEVADAYRFAEFLDLYREGDLSDDERISLMEILVQCVEDMEDQPDAELAWVLIEPFLLRKPAQHLSTVIYWARVDEVESEAAFAVSPRMRSLLRQLRVVAFRIDGQD